MKQLIISFLLFCVFILIREITPLSAQPNETELSKPYWCGWPTKEENNLSVSKSSLKNITGSKYKIKDLRNGCHLFKNDYLTASKYLALLKNGSYIEIDRQHSYTSIWDVGTWQADSDGRVKTQSTMKRMELCNAGLRVSGRHDSRDPKMFNNLEESIKSFKELIEKEPAPNIGLERVPTLLNELSTAAEKQLQNFSFSESNDCPDNERICPPDVECNEKNQSFLNADWDQLWVAMDKDCKRFRCACPKKPVLTTSLLSLVDEITNPDFWQLVSFLQPVKEYVPIQYKGQTFFVSTMVNENYFKAELELISEHVDNPKKSLESCKNCFPLSELTEIPFTEITREALTTQPFIYYPSLTSHEIEHFTEVDEALLICE